MNCASHDNPPPRRTNARSIVQKGAVYEPETKKCSFQVGIISLCLIVLEIDPSWSRLIKDLFKWPVNNVKRLESSASFKAASFNEAAVRFSLTNWLINSLAPIFSERNFEAKKSTCLLFCYVFTMAQYGFQKYVICKSLLYRKFLYSNWNQNPMCSVFFPKPNK